MARVIQVARVPSGEVAEVRSVLWQTGQTFPKGAIVIDTATGVTVAAADPLIALGVSLEPAGSRPGYDAANSPSTITGRLQEVSVAVFNKITVFSMTGDVDPVQADIGVSYGVDVAAGVWTLDTTNTTQIVFRVVDIDTDENLYFCIADDAIFV